MPKTVRRLDSITTYRERVPTNPAAAYKGPNMVFDHSKNMDVIPDRLPKVLIEATNHHPSGSRSQSMTMNSTGRSAVFATENNISVGGSGDFPGKVYETGHVTTPKGSKTTVPSPKWKK